MKPFEVFRVGNHKDSKGREIIVTKDMLDTIAGSYDKDKLPAPIVVGHPKSNDPAYGWIKNFSVTGDRLLAHPEEVDPEFEKLVQDGRFKSRSISLYGLNNTSNPVPGILYPRHIGFLGAQPPAVSGLKPVEFAGPDDGYEFTSAAHEAFFENYMQENPGSVFGVFKEFVETITATLKPGSTGPQFSKHEKEEPMTKKHTDISDNDFARREADLQEREEALAKRTREFSEQEIKRRAVQNQEFIDQLEKDGKVPPGQKAGLLAFMTSLEMDENSAFEFSQGENTVKMTPRDWFREMIGGATPVINFTEISAADADDGDPGEDADAIAEEARKYQFAQANIGISVSMTDAVAHVSKSRKS